MQALSTAIAAAGLFTCLTGYAQVSGSGTLPSGGRTRSFSYHLPVTLPPDGLPLVIACHGDGGTGAGFQAYAGLDAVADQQSFLVVYPNALNVGGGIQFNKYADAAPGFGTAGDPNGPSPADPNAPDDVAFVSDLIDYFYQQYHIDRNRVYATGHSGGGFFCYFLSLAIPQKIAAVAPVAASLWGNDGYLTNRFATGNYQPVPVLHIHSKGDGTVTPPIAPYPDPTPEFVWPLSNYAYGNCNNGSGYTTNPLNANVDSLTFCGSGKKVILLMTKDATHGWSTLFPVAQTMWNFFRNYQLTTYPNGPVTDPHLRIDQFGYQPLAKKIAVIANPQTGYDAGSSFTPGTVYQVRNAATNQVVFQAAPVAWNGGATHAQSGDKVWWFDFSTVREPGTYFILDTIRNVRSYSFQIQEDVYRPVLRQATRVFFYQRSGFAKQPPYAEAPWTDGAAFLGPEQDTNCKLVGSLTNPRDLRGGWFDAGDYNKYVPFTFGTLTDMLLAYEDNPRVWTDDFGIPESGNGIPDLLDEIKWELDWLRRMQSADGSLLHKVSVTDFSAVSPPSADTHPRRYGAASTDATATGAAVFALAALSFRSVDSVYADTLQQAAIRAYDWCTTHPEQVFSNTGFQSAAATYTSNDRLARRVAAAGYLFALTGNTAYRTFFDAQYTQLHLLAWSYAYPFEAAYQDALLYYTRVPAATPSVRNTILTTYRQSLQNGNTENLPAYLNQTDAYRAFLADRNYTWGSNETKSHQGSMFLTMNQYQLDTANRVQYRDAGLGFLHYLHGVNPTRYCYLTNMGTSGAGYSVQTMYHSWFGDGTAFDTNPPPGYLMGGANPTFAPDPSYAGPPLSPPQNQPVQKSYKSWNTSFPENSWELNEPAIYSQGAYLRLLAQAMCYTTAVTSIRSGNWTDPATWACRRVPLSTDPVIIAAGTSVTVSTSVEARKISLQGTIQYQNGGVLKLGQP
jgi:endoglucanase